MNGNDAKHYLQQPYARIVIPDEKGGYHAEILEFPGCYAQGESVGEAYKNLEETAGAWIEASLANGQMIPEPSSALGYGGNVLLRMPRSIHRQAAKMAARDRTSLNQYLLAAVSARVGADELYTKILRRLEHDIIMACTTFPMARAATSTAIDVTIEATPVDTAVNVPGREPLARMNARR